MTDIPKMKRFDPLKQLAVKVEKETDDIYRLGRKNGWDVSEIARQSLAETFKRLQKDLSRSAG